MTIKKIIFTISLGLFLCFSHLKAQTVYITESGKKYHAKNCDMVKTGKKGIDLALAKKQGYEPCSFCKKDLEITGDKPKKVKKKSESK
jgi:hypothetical protein